MEPIFCSICQKENPLDNTQCNYCGSVLARKDGEGELASHRLWRQITTNTDTAAEELERTTGTSLLMSLIAGAGAAILGGVVWGSITIFTGWEIGFGAWGLGGLAGYVVVTTSQGKRGGLYQGIAALSACLGILVAKYHIYVHFGKEFVREEYGETAASTISWFSMDVVGFFIDDFTQVFSGFDIIFIPLAVFTAWRIVSPRG